MKILTLILFLSASCFGQNGDLINDQAIKFTIVENKDSINFIVVDTLLNKKKPIFLWCQGSLPTPLFCEIENYGNYFFGGGIVNFDYKKIVQDYHLVVISMPKTPVVAKKENLNSIYQFVPDKSKPNEFLKEYMESDYQENYVNRALIVLEYLQEKNWVDSSKLIIAGHSQGTHVVSKVAKQNKNVTHMGLFSANPFGRVDQSIRESRLNAQLGKISWEKADSLINDSYDFLRYSYIKDSVKKYPFLKAGRTFSEPTYDDWLELDIPIYLAYGTEDRTSDLCDIIPLFFIRNDNNNLTLKRYLGLEHNFFEMDEKGNADYDKGHWKEVMNEFMDWIDKN